MKKIFVFVLGFLLLSVFAAAYQVGPQSQANFGNQKEQQNKDGNASAAKPRSLSTYGTGRTWDRAVQTQGVQTQGVQTQVAGRAKPEKEQQQEEAAPQGPFVDKADSQLSGLKGKISNGTNGKSGGAAKNATSPQGKNAADVAVGATQQPEETKAQAEPEQAAAMPAGMDTVMQQMGQMQNMMSMMGAMGAMGGNNANGASAGAAAGGMPAGMPDLSALMGNMGGMGAAGGGAKK